MLGIVAFEIKDETMAARILALARSGESLRKIARRLNTEPYMLIDAVERYGLTSDFDAARNKGLEVRADDLLDAHEMDDLERAKLASRNAQWLLSKRVAGIYGEKSRVDTYHHVDLGAAMRDAEARLTRPANDHRQLASSKTLDIPATYRDESRDTESIEQPQEVLDLFK